MKNKIKKVLSIMLRSALGCFVITDLPQKNNSIISENNILKIVKASDKKADESLYWNVPDTDNAGFIIPIERHCSNWRLYRTAEELIDKQQHFLCTMISGGKMPDQRISSVDDGFCQVSSSVFFGCGNMKELYEHYLTIFENNVSFKDFCRIFEGCLEDKNGMLSIKQGSFDFDTGGWLWNERSVIIYDKKAAGAKIIIALPKDIGHTNGEADRIYRFVPMKMVKSSEGWRLSGECLFVY